MSALTVAILLLKGWAIVGLLLGIRDAFREISSMHNVRLDPYGTTKFSAWVNTLRNVYWLVLPLYLFIYLIFWPWALHDKARWK